MGMVNSVDVELTGAQRQRGGRLNVKGWLIGLLLATSIASGVYNVVQHRERQHLIIEFIATANQVLAACHASATSQEKDQQPFTLWQDQACTFPGNVCEKIL